MKTWTIRIGPDQGGGFRLAYVDGPETPTIEVAPLTEVDRLRTTLADLIGNSGCMCDHPLVVGPCAKCRATSLLEEKVSEK